MLFPIRTEYVYVCTCGFSNIGIGFSGWKRAMGGWRWSMGGGWKGSTAAAADRDKCVGRNWTEPPESCYHHHFYVIGTENWFNVFSVRRPTVFGQHSRQSTKSNVDVVNDVRGFGAEGCSIHISRPAGQWGIKADFVAHQTENTALDLVARVSEEAIRLVS